MSKSSSSSSHRDDESEELDLDELGDLDVVILTEKEMLLEGLKIWHWTEEELKKGSRELNN
jgi:hypothetical protein